MKEIFDSIINLGFSIFNLIVNTLVRIFTCLIPKNPKRILIGLWRGNRFADNARYCYFELTKIPDLEVNLVVNDRKLYKILKTNNIRVVKKWSFKSLYLHVTSKYHIIDQDHKGLLGYFSANAVRIMLWHGVPLKKIWKLDVKAKNNKLAYWIEKLNQKIRAICKGYCSIGRWYVYDLVTPSKYDWDAIFSKVVFSDLVKPIFCKYPRVNYMLGNVDNVLLEEEKEYLKKIEEAKNENKKILFYAPTFRDESGTMIFGTKTDEELQDFISFLNSNDIALMVKMHAVERRKIEGVENCIFLDSNCDISVFMQYADGLITDYSSVYFDYLIFDKPIIFYPYDIDNYKTADRGFMVDYDTSTSGDKVYTLDELKECIKKLKNNKWKDDYKKAREETQKRIMDITQKSVGEYIEQKLKNY